MNEYPIRSDIPIPEPHREVYSIRYDGLTSGTEHAIDLFELGASIQGFARILGVCAHFAETGKYNKQFDSLSVKVYAVPTDEHHCFEVTALIEGIGSGAVLWSGWGTMVVGALVAYIFNRRQDREMKYLSEALKLALQQSAENTAKFLATIERLADGVRPAAKQALTPIGSSCKTISVNASGPKGPVSVVLDQRSKDELSIDPPVIQPARKFTGVISEMDMETGSCKVQLSGIEDAGRVNAWITDPVARAAGNPYVGAMAAKTALTFIAKAEIGPDGELVKLYISDTAEPEATE